MKHIVYYNNIVDSNPIQAYKVNLASLDGTFGIKRVEDDYIVVPSGTLATITTSGLYSYIFDLDANYTYLVSWQVYQNQNDTPQYFLDQVGPFYATNSSEIETTSQGLFIRGETGTLQINLTDINGQAVDPASIFLTVKNTTTSDTVAYGVPDKVNSGWYVYEWNIPAGMEPGDYSASWNYILEGKQSIETQNIVVSDSGSTSGMYSGRTLDLIKSLENSYLKCAQHIPVFYEQAKVTKDNHVYDFSFGQWNQSRGTMIFRNNNPITDGFEINYTNGEVIFTTKQTSYDFITANYNFRWFSDEEIYTYLVNAVSVLNSYPPMSPIYTIDSIPTRWIAGVMYHAAADALRELMLCLQFQQPQQVFGGEEGAKSAFSSFDTLKKNYETEWVRLFENKKYGPYPKGVVISVPEYTLPGGRSRWFRYLFQGAV